jgi:hypothetical protein
MGRRNEDRAASASEREGLFVPTGGDQAHAAEADPRYNAAKRA